MCTKFYLNGYMNCVIMNCSQGPKLLDNKNNPLSIQNNLVKIESDVKTRQAGFHNSNGQA